MRKLIIICWLIALPVLAAASPLTFEAFYRKYAGRSGYTTLEITCELLRQIGSTAATQRRDKELAGLLDQIDNITIVAAEQPGSEFSADLDRLAQQEEYRLMTSVNSGSQQVRLLLKPAGRKQKNEFLLLTRGDKENVAIKIVGDISVSNISALSRINAIRIGALDSRPADNLPDAIRGVYRFGRTLALVAPPTPNTGILPAGGVPPAAPGPGTPASPAPAPLFARVASGLPSPAGHTRPEAIQALCNAAEPAPDAMWITLGTTESNTVDPTVPAPPAPTATVRQTGRTMAGPMAEMRRAMGRMRTAVRQASRRTSNAIPRVQSLGHQVTAALRQAGLH